MGKSLLIAVLLALVAVVSFSPVSAQVPVTVIMNPLNDSGQSGTATLTPLGLQTVVDINITPGPAGVAQPAHIHAGRCPAVGAVTDPLADVVNGTSSTVLNVPIEQLTTGGFAINVHKSVPEIGISVACGDI